MYPSAMSLNAIRFKASRSQVQARRSRVSSGRLRATLGRAVSSTAPALRGGALVVLGCALALCAMPAHAEPGPPPAGDDASVVAAAVQAFYDQTHDLSATFFQTYVNKLYQRT